MMRKIVLLMSGLLLTFSVIASPANDTLASGATAFPDHIALTWTGDPATTMTVTWRTDIEVASGFIEYQKGTELANDSPRAKAESKEFVTDLGATHIFSATLEGLSPHTQYSYRVGEEEHWSQPHTFTTADSKVSKFKFLVFGDSQSLKNNDSPLYAVWCKTIQAAYRSFPEAAFFVNVGDLVDLGQKGEHWNGWFSGAEGVIDRIPAMPVPGNHESYGSLSTARPEYFVAQFSLPQNGPEGLKGQVYSYDYGPVHFVVLDSQQEEQAQYGDILKIQQSWLDADLAASRAKWKIVFFHKPPYEVMAQRPNEDIKEAFCPIMEQYHVDLVFNAHDHGIARTYPINRG